MPNKLFVGNLSFSVTDAQLAALFAELQIPVAEIMLMCDQETGRSRGFAFAQLAPEADMASAIKQLSGRELNGRQLTVNEARPHVKRDFGGSRPSGGFGQNRSQYNDRNPRQQRPKRKTQELY